MFHAGLLYLGGDVCNVVVNNLLDLCSKINMRFIKEKPLKWRCPIVRPSKHATPEKHSTKFVGLAPPETCLYLEGGCQFYYRVQSDDGTPDN